MSVKSVLQEPDRKKPNKILRTKTEIITDFSDPLFNGLIKDMKDTMRQQNGAGLAAPQIGVSKRIFVINQQDAPKVRTIFAPLSFIRPLYPTVFVNPTITYYSKQEELQEEGCLSILDEFYPTLRATSVTLQAQNEKGVKFTVQARGMLARIFQHETDHLNGMLYIDRIYEQLNKS